MTKAEYAREYRQARRETARLVISGKREIRREYIKAFSRIAKVIRENRHKPFLEEQIRSAFPKQELYRFLMRFIMEGRKKAVKLETDINKRYILEALEKVPGHGLSAEKISRLFDGIAEKHGQGSEPLLTPPVNPLQAPLLSANSKRHTKLPKRPVRPCTCRHTHFAVVNVNGKTYYTVKNVKEKTYHGQSTGVAHDFTFRQSYSLSKSVWGAMGDTEDKIMNVVWGGISQGRDVRSVATDLMAYLKGGPEIVKGRWGKLEPGTKEYAKRLGSKGVDYRAMRLYRSEIHRNQQEAAVTEGEDNPACTGEYDWILMPGRGVFMCTCPELAAGGPYTKETIPDYPHPNCDCMIEPRLANSDDLIRDLKDYVNGVPSEGANEISLWAQQHGLGEDKSGVKPQEPEPKQKAFRTLTKEDLERIGSMETLDLVKMYSLDEINDYIEQINAMGTDVDSMLKGRARMRLMAARDRIIEELEKVKYSQETYKYLKDEKEHFGDEYEKALESERDMLDEEKDRWYEQLSRKETLGIYNYSSDHYYEMNQALFGKRDMTPEIQKWIDGCTEAIEKFKLKEDIITWKGVNKDDYYDYEIGKTYQYPALNSSTIKFDTAFDKDMIIQFRIQKETPGAYLGNKSYHKREDEFLLQKGLKYTVIERGWVMHKGKDKPFMILEVVKEK